MTDAPMPPTAKAPTRRTAKLRVRALILIVSAGTVAAVFWSLSMWRAKTNRFARHAPNGQTLKVLSVEGVLSKDLIAKFEGETGVQVLVDTVTSPDDIWSRILEAEATPADYESVRAEHESEGPEEEITPQATERSTDRAKERVDTPPTNPAIVGANSKGTGAITRLYDVIALFSFQIHAAALRDRIARLDAEKLPSFEETSVDFRDLPLEGGRGRFVPLLWGINGMAIDTARASRKHDSWESVFSDASLKGRISLLGSPLDVLYVLAHRREQNEALALLESDDDPDERADELRKPLNSLAQEAKILPEKAFIGPEALGLAAEVSAAIQISHGEAASRFGSGMKDGLKEPWTFVVPAEKAPLWVLGFAVAEGTPRQLEALQFLEFLLEAETAKDLTQQTGVASANTRLERDRELHPWLKPSHLRRVPYRQLHFVRDFHAGPAVRGVIRSAVARVNGKNTSKGSAQESRPVLTGSPHPSPGKTSSGQRLQKVEKKSASTPPDSEE